MLSRKNLIGINFYNDSCWLASTLQAIVDCPPLLNLILNFERKINSEIEIQKEDIKLYLLQLKSIKYFIAKNQSAIHTTKKKGSSDVNTNEFTNNVYEFNCRLEEINVDYTYEDLEKHPFILEFNENFKTLDEIIVIKKLPTIQEIDTFLELNFSSQINIKTKPINRFYWHSYEFDVELRKYFWGQERRSWGLKWSSFC